MTRYQGGKAGVARYAWHALLWPCLLSQPATAQDQGDRSIREFRTQDERLEAGQQRQLAEWLTLITVAELEWEHERRSPKSGSVSEEETGSTLVFQAGLTASPLEWLQGDLEVEYDSELDDVVVDEAVLAAEFEPFEFEVGKDSLAFGEYFSRFTTGPLLEFGETTETAISIGYGVKDAIDFSVSAYEGRAERAGADGSDVDQVVAVELWPESSFVLGMGYITDLADSDERLLSETSNLFTRKVPALSGYALWKGGAMEATVEYITALRSFRELAPDRDRPSAWNAELAVFPLDDVSVAFRLEGSRELDDAPAFRAGIAVSWFFHDKAILTVEALRSRFEEGFVTDEEDNPIDDGSTIALQLLVAF